MAITLEISFWLLLFSFQTRITFSSLTSHHITNMGISEATEILKNSSMGLYSVRPKKHPICVNLKSQDMFDALISLNEGFFRIHYPHFKHLVEYVTLPPSNSSPHKYIVEAEDGG